MVAGAHMQFGVRDCLGEGAGIGGEIIRIPRGDQTGIRRYPLQRDLVLVHDARLRGQGQPVGSDRIGKQAEAARDLRCCVRRLGHQGVNDQIIGRGPRIHTAARQNAFADPADQEFPDPVLLDRDQRFCLCFMRDEER